jgi:Chlorophyll A-B binding protein
MKSSESVFFHDDARLRMVGFSKCFRVFCGVSCNLTRFVSISNLSLTQKQQLSGHKLPKQNSNRNFLDIMKLLIAAATLALALPTAVAFQAPSTTKASTALGAQMNGWTPSENQFAYGLPGKVAPFTEGFDPFNIAGRASLDDMKSFRESEVTHGRVAMLAGTYLIS